MGIEWRKDNILAQGFFVGMIILFGLSLVGSVFTLLAINVLFDASIPITFATVFSVAWLKMVIHAFFRSAKGVYQS